VFAPRVARTANRVRADSRRTTGAIPRLRDWRREVATELNGSMRRSRTQNGSWASFPQSPHRGHSAREERRYSSPRRRSWCGAPRWEIRFAENVVSRGQCRGGARRSDDELTRMVAGELRIRCCASGRPTSATAAKRLLTALMPNRERRVGDTEARRADCRRAVAIGERPDSSRRCARDVKENGGAKSQESIREAGARITRSRA